MERTLTGNFDRNLDEKYRLAIPRPLRKQFSQEEEFSLFIAPGTEQSLALYLPSVFQARSAVLSQQATNGVEARNYFRMLYGFAEEAAVDRQGRIRIPERLVEHAGLSRDVVLIGVFDHAEIWDKKAWTEFLATNQSKFDVIATTAFQ